MTSKTLFMNRFIIIVSSMLLIIFFFLNNAFCSWAFSNFLSSNNAEYFLSRAISKDSSFFQAYLDRGWLYYKKFKIKEALNDFNEAYKINKNDSSLLFAFALLKKEFNDVNGCLKDLNKIIKKFPDFPWSYVTRSNILREKGRISDALADLMRFEEIKGDFESALNFANQILSFTPNNHRVILKRAEINVILKKYDNAFKDFDKAIELNSSIQWYFFKRGNFRMQMGDKDGAFYDFCEAVKLDTNFSEGYEKAAEICLLRNDIDKYNFYMHEAYRSHKFHGRNNLAQICNNRIINQN